MEASSKADAARFTFCPNSPRERGQVIDVSYRGGASWVEPAPDVWTVIESEHIDGGSDLRIKVMKSRDRLLSEGRVVAVSVDYQSGQYTLI